MTLPAHDGAYSRCVKCGQHGDHFTRYRGANPPTWDPVALIRLTLEEHLERECRNCGYLWAEACMEPRPSE